MIYFEPIDQELFNAPPPERQAFPIFTNWWSKTFYNKQRPKLIHYRIYKNSENDYSRHVLKEELLKFDITNAPLAKFNDTVLSALDKYAPKKKKKKKSIRSNNSNFMTKKLRRAIMN